MAREQRRTARVRRHARVRAKIKGTPSRPRLCVFRSLNNVYAQIIDDTAGHTLAAASTIDPELRSELDSTAKTERSALVGTLIARRALSQGVTQVAFDRGGRKYHGRVKALAEAAREGGLKF